MVEGDGRAPYGRHELVLQQADIVIIEVYVGEYLLEHGVEHLTRLYHLADARALLPLDDVFLGARLLAVYMLGHRLVHREGQGQLVVPGRKLHLVQHVVTLAEELVVQLLGLDVIQGERQLLVLVVLVVVIILQRGALLGGNHPSHQLHGGVVLAAIPTPLRPHHHLLERLAVFPQLHQQVLLVGRYLYHLGLIAHGTHRHRPAIVAIDAETPHAIRRDRNVIPLVRNASVRYSYPVIIYYPSPQLFLSQGGQNRNQ